MKKPIPFLLLSLILLLIGGALLYRSFCCQCCGTNMVTNDNKSSSSLLIADENRFNASSGHNLQFLNAGFDQLNPNDTEVNAAFQKTADYLKANPKRIMNIVGQYGEKENNTSIYPNLGLARANNVKNWFVKAGISPAQLTTEGQMIKDLAFVNDTLNGGVNFSFGELSAATNNTGRLDSIKNRLSVKPIILYFETNQSNLTLTESQRQDFADISYYLDNKADAKVLSTGHTDNKGNADRNQTLSASRAEFVKSYLSKNGIKAEQILTNGKGQTQPIAPNDTDANRAKNRRVEVSIQ